MFGLGKLVRVPNDSLRGRLMFATCPRYCLRVPNDNLSLLVADYAHSGQGRNQTTPVTTETDETLTRRRGFTTETDETLTKRPGFTTETDETLTKRPGFTTRAETPPDGAQSSTKRTQTLAVLLNGRSMDGD